ncbi:hypothetical protein [Maridesulfovibrio sp.]|uniref:hypothetical protein n=1 Tax=Maridesulfovibrio sp. TaxID=2795000 RepID=UPI002A18D0AB|nr:hypothetical protein [Maridesulfovibrio sp.]
MQHKKQNGLSKDRKIFLILFGVLAIAGGLATLSGGSLYKGIPVMKIAGWTQLAAGIFWIWYALFYKRSTNMVKVAKEEETICPKCQKVYMAGQAPANTSCESCGVNLEPLEGFYDRHPELRDKKDEAPDDLMDDLK